MQREMDIMYKRNTIQRALALEAVRELQCHVTADEVYAAVAAKHPDISRATIYRNLKLLAEMGEIRKLEMPGGADRYDHRCHAHYHARCLKCGRVFDLDMDPLAGLEENISNDIGFLFTGHDLVFKGICQTCCDMEDGRKDVRMREHVKNP